MRYLMAWLLLFGADCFAVNVTNFSVGTLISTGTLVSQVPNSGITYLMNQNFETGTQPAGWTPSGSVNWGYQPALAGTYSMYITNDTPSAKFAFGATNTATIYAKFIIGLGATPSGTIGVFSFRGTNNTVAGGGISHRSSTGIIRMSDRTGSHFVDLGTFTSASTNWVWLDYTPGATGTGDGTIVGWIASSDSKPGSPTGTINSADTIRSVDGIQVAGTSTGTEFDNIQASLSPIP